MKKLAHGVIVDDDFHHKGKIWLRKGYAHITVNGKEVALHRHIMDAQPHQKVDHRNQNRLDCRKENLRFYESEKQNQANVRSKGYSWHKRAGKWVAQIKIDGKNKYLGLYKTEEQAQKAYRKAHVEAFREFSPYFEELEK
jgi:AP2 domain